MPDILQLLAVGSDAVEDELLYLQLGLSMLARLLVITSWPSCLEAVACELDHVCTFNDNQTLSRPCHVAAVEADAHALSSVNNLRNRVIGGEYGSRANAASPFLEWIRSTLC